MEGLSAWLQDREQQMIEEIGALVGIESVADGRHVEECGKVMDQMTEFARRDGMEAVRHGDHCMCITMGDAGTEIGVWSHLDVVPAKGEWVYTPFSLQVKEGFLIGRGVQDNKGPAVAAYYAMRWCKEISACVRFLVSGKKLTWKMSNIMSGIVLCRIILLWRIAAFLSVVERRGSAAWNWRRRSR